MKSITFAAAVLAVAIASVPAAAGVVITQEQTANGQFGERKSSQTIMVQGNKQKMISSGREIITDLDNNKMYLVDPSKSTYIQIPFPPTGPMAAAMARGPGQVDFKKADTTRNVLGYSCTDYTGSGQSLGGDYKVTECFSTSAPGAKEFTTFQKALATKLKEVVPMTNAPDGIPLASDSTVSMANMKLPNLSPEQQQQLQKQLANMKPVTTKTVVTKLESKDLPADTFTVPKGYTERKIGMPPTAGGPASSPEPVH